MVEPSLNMSVESVHSLREENVELKEIGDARLNSRQSSRHTSRSSSRQSQSRPSSVFPVSTGILPHSLPEWAFRARPGLWQICLCPKVARIAEHKFGCR